MKRIILSEGTCNLVRPHTQINSNRKKLILRRYLINCQHNITIVNSNEFELSGEIVLISRGLWLIENKSSTREIYNGKVWSQLTSLQLCSSSFANKSLIGNRATDNWRKIFCRRAHKAPPAWKARAKLARSPGENLWAPR